MLASSASYTQARKKVLALAQYKEKLGWIDLQGREVIPLVYDDNGFWGDELVPMNKGAKVIDFLKKGGLWGYLNTQGETVIPFKFDRAHTFSNGLAIVQYKKKWGIINVKGEFVVQPQFEEIDDVSEGKCSARKGELWGFIDLKGNWVIQPKYHEVRRYDQGVAVVAVRTKSQYEFEEYAVRYGMIDSAGNPLLDTVYEMIWWFKEGLAKIETISEQAPSSTKIGFVNRKGEIVIKPVYDTAEDFREGLAVVGIRQEEDKGRVGLNYQYKYGYVNNSGEELIGLQYDGAQPFHNGYAVVSRGRQRRGGFVLTDDEGKILNGGDWPSYGLIDKKGAIAIDFKYRWLSPLPDSLYLAERSGYSGQGVIDLQEHQILPFKYTNLRYLGGGYYSNSEDTSSDQVEIIDRHGSLVLKSKKFAMPASIYQYGLFDVRTERLSKSGCIDTSGNWVIPAKYDMIWEFNEVNKK
jgi:hypothetical protein